MRRIQEERLRVVLTANSATVLLYRDIGRVILDRQEREGWGAKVTDRLAADLREASPGMKGISPHNLEYLRAFAAAWPDRAIVQEALARITWYRTRRPWLRWSGECGCRSEGVKQHGARLDVNVAMA